MKLNTKILTASAVVLALLGTTQVYAALFNQDARDYPTVSIVNATQHPNAQDGEWAQSATARPGDTVSIEVYYHNNGPTPSDVAYNVHTWLALAQPNGGQQTITGGVFADNAGPASGQATLSIVGGNGSESLQFIPGSVRWYPNQSATAPQPLLNGQTGQELFNSNGLYVGNQNPGWYAQANVVADFRVVGQTPPPPPPPVPPVACPTLQTQLASNISQNSGTLNAVVNGVSGIGDMITFEYGPTPSLGQAIAQTPAVNGNMSQLISNLQPGTTYYFRADLATPNCAPVVGQTLTFTTGQVAANLAVTTLPTTNITQNFATLNGSLSASTFNNVVRWFEWGPTVSLGTRTSNQSVSANSNFSDSVSGLLPNTTYYFRAAAMDASGVPVYGGILSFTTPTNFQQQCPLITVNTLGPVNVTGTSADLQGSTLNSQSTQTNGWFEIGPTPSFGQTTQQQSVGNGLLNQSVLNLAPNTTYYFRADAQALNAGNCSNTIQYGQTLTFITGAQQIVPPPAPQGVQTQPATEITRTSGRLNALAFMNNLPANGWFEWGPTVALGSQTSPVDLGNFTSNTFFAYLNNLQPASTYYFRAVLQNRANGTILRGNILTFTTLPLAPTVFVPPPVTPQTPPVYTPPVRTGYVSPAHVSIVNSVGNLSFPNGTTECVAGFVGNTIDYTLSVKNSGASQADGLTVRDVLSQYTDFKSASDGGVYNAGTREVVWQIALGPHQKRDLHLQAVVNRVTDNEVAGNQAMVSTPSGAEKMSGTTHLIVTVNPVTITIITDKNAVQAGETINYTLLYRNESHTAINNVLVRLVIPADATFVSADQGTYSPENSTVSLQVASMQPKEEGKLHINVVAGANIHSGEILVASALIDYQDAVGSQQIEARNFLPVRAGGEAAGAGMSSINGGATSPGLSALFGTGFLPQSLLGWLTLIIILLILIYIARRTLSGDGHTNPPPPSLPNSHS